MAGVAEVASSGDQRKTLEALRDSLAAALDAAPPTVKAQVAAQLRATLADLRSLPGAAAAAPAGVVTIDDAKRKRAARQAAAVAPVAEKGGRQRRG